MFKRQSEWEWPEVEKQEKQESHERKESVNPPRPELIRYADVSPRRAAM